MAFGEGQNTLQMARQATGAVRHQKALYEGDVGEGFMFVGQATGGVSDLPTVQELVDRMVAEAEATLKASAAKIV